MSNNPSPKTGNSPRSFYFPTGSISPKQLKEITPAGLKVETVVSSNLNITQINLQPEAEATQILDFYANLKKLEPATLPNLKLSSPAIEPSEATNPNGIPTGGGDGGPKGRNRTEQVKREFESLKFHHTILDEILKDPDLKLKRPRRVDVILIDTIPAFDIAEFAYKTGNADLKTLVHDLQTGRLRFRPTQGQFDLVPRRPAKSIKLPPTSGKPPTKLSSHGLFSANLIRQIAPDAHITVIQGLDEDGEGNMVWFMGLLQNELKWIIDANRAEDKKGVVLVNLSLVCKWSQQIKDAFGVDLQDLTDNFNSVLGWLFPNIFTANETNVRILAAAGNDGLPNSELPAALGQVIEVVAVDRKGDFAPYTNKFDRKSGKQGIKAFGGPVSSVFVDRIAGEENKFGYASWSGTSFATAIASGVMARLCLAGLSPGEARAIINARPEIMWK